MNHLPTTIVAHHALTAEGWQKDVCVRIAEDGGIASVTHEAPAQAVKVDVLLPGIANVHSHAFQRAMAGLTEHRASHADHFWSWREVMYRFVGKLTPEQHEAIARYLYIEMLKSGYTAVAEFHYLHHAPDGSAYAAPTEMADRAIAAAQEAGIYQRHLPVLYATGNFGGVAATPGQKRFLHGTEPYLKLLESLMRSHPQTSQLGFGIAPHSLRAVTPEMLQQVLDALPGLGLEDAPIHLHIAEQVKEVEDCLQWSGQRPMAWLLEHMPVDQRWCLIHATHLDAGETKGLARSGAVAGLCPTTEANLGDGIFPLPAYLEQGGRMGIGSDSHITVDPFAELRMMEYVQRLVARQRNVLASEAVPSTGTQLYQAAAAGGAQAVGLTSGRIQAGQRADLVALDISSPFYEGKEGHSLLDTAIFGLTSPAVQYVWVNGQQVVFEGRHAAEEKAEQAFREAMRHLAEAA